MGYNYTESISKHHGLQVCAESIKAAEGAVGKLKMFYTKCDTYEYLPAKKCNFPRSIKRWAMSTDSGSQ